MGRLDGKVTAITGATSGAGLRMAEAVATKSVSVKAVTAA
jgi:NADP-dependent 3-hydroxy acid dehydrogenase YdfG